MEEIKSEIRSTIGDLNSFRNSLVAKDMKRQLVAWKRDLIAMYPSTENLLDKGRIDGRLEAIVYIMSLPDLMIQFKEEELNYERGLNKAD